MISHYIKLFALIILSILFCLSFGSAYALIVSDREIFEAGKCSRFFPYFEKRYGIPYDTLYSISLVESGKSHSKHNIRVLWPWTVNVEGQGYYFDTKKEAVIFVKNQLKEGKKSIDVGCMQISLKHHPEAFKTIEHAFDPMRNIDYAARFLRSKYDSAGDWIDAVGRYHSGTYHLGKAYKQKVVKVASGIKEYKSKLRNYAFAPVEYSSSLHSARYLRGRRPITKLASDNKLKDHERFNYPIKEYSRHPPS